MSDMSHFERFEHLFQSVQNGARGTYWSQLSEEDQTLILRFLSESTDLTDKTRSSYKSYLSKAIIMPDSLTSDQKSALRKFALWLKNA